MPEMVHDSQSGTLDSEMQEENEGRACTRRCFVARFAARPSGRNDYVENPRYRYIQRAYIITEYITRIREHPSNKSLQITN